MLFSPPNEFGNLFLFRLITLTAIAHILLLAAFFLGETWFGLQPLTFPLKGSGSPISLMSGRSGPIGRKTAHSQTMGIQDPLVSESAPSSSSDIKKAEVAPKINEKIIEQKAITAIPVKQESIKKESQKKDMNKKKETKPTVKKDTVVKKITKPDIQKTSIKKDAEKPKVKELKKVSEIKKEISPNESKKKQLKKISVPKNEPLPESTLTSHVLSRNADGSAQKYLENNSTQTGQSSGGSVEFEAGQASLSADVVVQEFASHFTLPPGFDDIEPFTVCFEINDGKVINISPHGRESLVVYTAVKDALLRSTMPRARNRKITMLIT